MRHRQEKVLMTITPAMIRPKPTMAGAAVSA
jgi:hypothetical protein